MAKKQQTQHDKFVEKARELGVDETADALDDVLRRVTKPKTKKKPSDK